MSLDDVVIIMSIPRRLVLTTRRRKTLSTRFPQQTGRPDHKAAPVVVFKGDPDNGGDYRGDYNGGGESTGGFGSPGRRDHLQYRDARTLTWDRNPKPDRSDPKYFPVNSLPRQRVPNTSLSPPRDAWRGARDGRDAVNDNYSGGSIPPPMHALPTYQPPPPVVTEQPRGTSKEPQHFKPYKHSYGGQAAQPKTLASLAEKVHNYNSDADFYNSSYARPDSALGEYN